MVLEGAKTAGLDAKILHKEANEEIYIISFTDPHSDCIESLLQYSTEITT
jgi:hypothetical protein